MEIWDAYRRDETLAGVDLIRGESIPDGLYHIVCEALVRHADGDYLLMQRDYSKQGYGGWFEATAGGSALKGEDSLTCIKRELAEETGIVSGEFTMLKRKIYEDNHCIFDTFLCVTDCDKDSITLQEGETIAYKWLNKRAFAEFARSDKIIGRQRDRFLDYYVKEGILNREDVR